MPTTIRLESGGPVIWPMGGCACCGEQAAQLTEAQFIEVEQVKRTRDGAQVTRHIVPSCGACRLHYEEVSVKEYSASSILFMTLFFAGAFVGFGVGKATGSAPLGIVVFVLWVAAELFVVTRFADKSQSRAETLLKSNCSGTYFVRIEQAVLGSTRTFTFTNSDYAREFARRNDGQEVRRKS